MKISINNNNNNNNNNNDNKIDETSGFNVKYHVLLSVMTQAYSEKEKNPSAPDGSRTRKLRFN